MREEHLSSETKYSSAFKRHEEIENTNWLEVLYTHCMFQRFLWKEIEMSIFSGLVGAIQLCGGNLKYICSELFKYGDTCSSSDVALEG